MFKEYSIGLNGANVVLDTYLYNTFTITGTVTITSNKLITSQSPLVVGKPLFIIYKATTTYNGATLSLFGKTLTQEEAKSKGLITVFFNGTDYEVVFTKDSSGLIELGSESIVISNATVSLDADINKKIQILTGSSLVGTFTLNSSNNPKDGDGYIVYYNGTLSSGTINIFGYILNTTEKLNGNLLFYIYYSDILGGFIVKPLSIKEEIIQDLCTPVSFESGEQGTYSYVFGERVQILQFKSSVKKGLSGTDNGTIQPKNTGVNMGTSLITHLASASFGNTITTTPTTNNILSTTDSLDLEVSKSTVGGKALVYIKYKRLL